MDMEERIKLFGLNNLSIESEIRRTEQQLGIVFRAPAANEDKDEEFYPQFPQDIRREAANMARHYEIFYCLETFIRQLISERLKEEAGATWWDDKVPEKVRKNAQDSRNKESASGVTLRSEDMIDYTTFGELGEIIRANEPIFSDTFKDLAAVSRVMFNLNTLRNPIAHCSPLAEDEVVRLQLSMRDWFRLMG